jgi:hypothetical protein
MAINRGQIRKQTIPGLNAVLGASYGSVPEQHLPLFEIENSDRSFEEEVMFTDLGNAPVKTEGAAVQYDDMQETWTSRYVHETISLAFSITEEAMEDNLYDTFAKVRAKALGRSMAQTKQIKAAAVFNNGFSSGSPGGDGVALFSSSHPTIGDGNQSNTTNTDLSESALETVTINISLMKDERGKLINAMAESLHIPPQLMYTAHRILHSTLSTTVNSSQASGFGAAGDGVAAKNDINALRSMSVLPKGVFVNHYFTDTNAWFIRTNISNGTKMFVRRPLSYNDDIDFSTGNILYKVSERYSFGWSDWRQWYGSSGAS